MKAVPIKQAISLVKKSLKTSKREHLVLLTHKKDRSLTIDISQEQVQLKEQGYQNQVTNYQLSSDAKHAIVSAFKREFPRSHQVYVEQISEKSQL